MTKIGIFSNTFYRYPLTDALRRIREIGYDSVEIGCYDEKAISKNRILFCLKNFGGLPHINLDEIDVKSGKELKYLLDEIGLEVSQMSPYGSYPYGDEETREATVSTVGKAAMVGSLLGAKTVRAGHDFLDKFPLPEVSEEKKTEWVAQSLGECVDVASSYGLKVTSDQPEEYDVVKKVGSPNLGINLHPTKESIKAYAPIIFHVHINENSLPLGEWMEIAKMLRDIGYLPDKPFNIERYGEGREKRAVELFEYARTILAELFGQ